MICKKHATQLSRMVKGIPVPSEVPVEEATWTSKEMALESQEEEEVMMSGMARKEVLVPKKQKPVGKPRMYTSLERLKIALLAVTGVSLSGIAETMAISKATTMNELVDWKGPSRDTVVQCLGELFQAYKFHLAEKLAASTSLNIMIDATTDTSRELLALHFAGVIDQQLWRRAASVIEVSGHKAAFQVDIMAKLLQDLNKYQEKLGLNLQTLPHYLPDN